MLMKTIENANLCLDKRDRYLEERAHWVATLSDGVVVYGDDDRGDEKIAWKRLVGYCNDNYLTIQALALRFRSYIMKLDISECDRVAVVNSVFFSYPNVYKSSYNIVFEKNKNCNVVQYILPELLIVREFSRNSECYEHMLMRINHG